MTQHCERDLVLRDVILRRPVRHADTRGRFSEDCNAAAFAEAGIGVSFVQDNHSLSRRAGTLRGLHVEAPPCAQARPVRCARGRILDIVVDIRRGSPTFRHAIAELDAASGTQIRIPEGFAHGFCTPEDDSDVICKVNVAYHGASDRGLAFDGLPACFDFLLEPAQ